MGNWQPTIYLLPSLVAFLVTIWLAIRLWAERRVRGGMAFFVLVLALAIWSGVYTLEVVALDRTLKIAFAQIKYAGIVVAPIAWFFFTASFAEKKWATSQRLMLILSIMPVITGILALTNEQHGIVWESGAQIITDAAFPAYLPNLNLWFWLHTAYSYCLFLAGMGFVFGVIRRSTEKKRRQAIIMFVGIGVAFLFNALSVLAANPLNNLDLSPVGFVIAGFSFAWVLLRLQLMELMPAAGEIPLFELDSNVQDILDRSRQNSLTLLINGTVILGSVAVLAKWAAALVEPQINWLEIGTITISYAIILVLYMAKKLPYAVKATAFVAAWYFFSLVTALFNGLEFDIGVTLVGFCVFTFLLLGIYAGIFAILLSSFTIGVVGWFTVTGFITTEAQYVAGGSLLSIIVGLVIFTLATVIASLTEHRLQKDTQNLIAQSQLLSQQIEQHRTLLEKRVSERTRVLEASFNISRQIAGLVDRSEIVREVMKLVHETFNFYHIYIYLFDEQKEYLEAVGGIGEVGSLMAAQRHRIPRGAGLVGQAAQKNKTVRVLDVGSEPIWLAHKLLPETKSEVVVPIALGNDVLGVLGVQEREIAGISEEAASLLESIASQVAFSLQNAKNFQMTQQQIQHEALINHVSQQIRQTNDRQKAIQVAVRELGRALHVPQTIIQLQDRPPHVKKHSV